jgi:hypothetical protein
VLLANFLASVFCSLGIAACQGNNATDTGQGTGSLVSNTGIGTGDNDAFTAEIMPLDDVVSTTAGIVLRLDHIRLLTDNLLQYHRKDL